MGEKFPTNLIIDFPFNKFWYHFMNILVTLSIELK